MGSCIVWPISGFVIDYYAKAQLERYVIISDDGAKNKNQFLIIMPSE